MFSRSSIQEVELFFNIPEEERLNFLIRMLMEETHSSITHMLDQKNLPRRLVILLHGVPGTGKTAAAFRIARKTGRSLFFAEFRTGKMVWSESLEKKVSKLFSKYRRAVRTMPLTPVLLIRQMDWLPDAPKEAGKSASEHAVKRLQNIFLEEMESLEGILIITMNKGKRIDPSIEKKFHYTVFFRRPGQRVRQRIWLSKVPFLTKAEALMLSRHFRLTGAEIGDVARKVTDYFSNSGEIASLSVIEEICAGKKKDAL